MKWLFVILIVIYSTTGLTRPQYANRSGSVSCDSCHLNPAGGGIRTIIGKAYGSHGLGFGTYSANQHFQGDMRTIALFPTANSFKSNNTGLGLMNAILSASAPITNSNQAAEMRAVVAYDAAPFFSGIQEAYLRYQTVAKDGKWLPRYITWGRFAIPFGLLTEEHRTYTKLQSRTDMRTFEMGVMLSSSPSHKIHYDLALVNGQGTGGDTGLSGGTTDFSWAIVPNLRLKPFEFPLTIGISGNFLHLDSSKSPYSVALYSVASISEQLDWSFELVRSRYLNDENRNSNMTNFINSTKTAALYQAIRKSTSLGLYSLLNYKVGPKTDLVYKLEALTLDENYLSDAYLRHGVGIKRWINSNLNLIIRYEHAMINRAGIKESGVYAGRDFLMLILHAWL